METLITCDSASCHMLKLLMLGLLLPVAVVPLIVIAVSLCKSVLRFCSRKARQRIPWYESTRYQERSPCISRKWY